ncbi:MAG: copper amine oxidase N-terminal domain-containing protein [Clostridia bacterium]|nr:copper amine oxidase N-terminal domain-containing protein [Clostridia bacterium]
MKKSLKLVALLVLTCMIGSLFSGCSADEAAIFNAFIKSMSINSMESKTDLTLKFDAEGLSSDDEEAIGSVKAVLNNLKISLKQKSVQNQDKTVSKAEMNALVNLGGVSAGVDIWVDSDLTGKDPKFKEVVKLPAIATLAIPGAAKGKEYLVMDQVDFSNISSLGTLDFAKAMGSGVEFGKNLLPKYIAFLEKYGAQFDSGLKYVTKKEDKVVNGETFAVYQVKLDDATFKALLKYAAENLLKNEDALNFIKDIMISMSEMPVQDKGSMLTKEQIEGAFNNVKIMLPLISTQVGAVIDGFKDVSILGDGGVVIDYTLNKEGYIVNEKGSIDLKIDLASLTKTISQLAGIKNNDPAKGVFKINLEYNTENSNINKDIAITLPALTKQNSVTLSEIVEGEEDKEYKYRDEIRVYINGKRINMNEDPRLEGGRLMVPLRDISEGMGAEVKWDGKTKKVNLLRGTANIEMKVGANGMSVNGESISTDASPKLINGKVYVPVRYIAEGFKAEVNWDSTKKKVKITVTE